MRRHLLSLLLGCLVISGVGCGKHERPNMNYMPDMVYSPAIKAQETVMRTPVKGTVPRGFKPYAYPDNPEASIQMKNPLARTKANLMRGKELFNTFCIVCHGEYGEGDGYVVPMFPRPPSLQSDKIKGYTDGRIYHVITMGQNLMPSYASQILQQDRWAIIHYLRVLHRAKNPSAADLKALEAWE
jgi:mono/diheme cytochrome c family protein